MISCIRATARTEPVGLVRHLVDFDLHASRVVSMDIPTFVAHVAGREEADGAIAFAEDDAVVDVGGRLDECCVDCDVE